MSQHVYDTTREQIGHSALYMLGACNFVGDKNSLSFKIKGSPRRVTHIRITLTPEDLYRVEFLRCLGTNDPVTVADRHDIYSNALCSVIETETGLRTSL